MIPLHGYVRKKFVDHLEIFLLIKERTPCVIKWIFEVEVRLKYFNILESMNNLSNY